MTLTALRCPNCAALLHGEGIKFCSYCGATLVDVPPAGEARVVSVYLDDAGQGDDKIAVIQAIWKHLHLPLVESRDLVNTAPCVLAKDIAEPLAQTLVVELRKLKATVRIG